MTRGPRIIASFAGSWRFEEVSVDQTRVEFRYNLRAMPWLLTPFIGWIFGRDTRKRLNALKAAVEQKGLLTGNRQGGSIA
jgi:ribosome-associated toxin RatA of RatAB toxin-antitoxin module